MDFNSSTLHSVKKGLDKKTKKKSIAIKSIFCYSFATPFKLTVRVGSSYHANGGFVVKLKRIVDHKKFKFVEKVPHYDFSLFELAEPLKFTDQIQPIALPIAYEEIPDGTMCMISGWGKRIECIQ